MLEDAHEEAIRERVLIRLDTLIRLRWYAIIGQTGAVLVMAFGFQFPMPWQLCLALIAVSVVLNLLLLRRYNSRHRLPANGAFILLAIDIIQLGLLLYLTGGLQNPFAILLMAPVIVSSTSLRRVHILLLGILVVVVTTALAFLHYPLPWDPAQPLDLPFLYVLGAWVAIICTLGFTAIYAFRVAEEARKLDDALSATELVLQREQHLSALDGLAAAAAHELGTPLATIALVSKEMVHQLPKTSDMHEDAALLRSQAERCREILQKLTSLSSQGESIIEQQSLPVLIEEEVAPLRDFGIDIAVHLDGDKATVPTLQRNPGVHYGLGNLLDNAVDFAKSSVVVVLRWSDDIIAIEISDDGTGFPDALLGKLGDPFVTSRKSRPGSDQRGMGLGLFIAKTLLERSGAEVSFSNGADNELHHAGALVRVLWQRDHMNWESGRQASMVNGATEAVQ